MAREFAARDDHPALAEFLQEISLFSDSDALAEERSDVTLMTLHNAKGLEYRAVFIIGHGGGDLPALPLDRGAGDRGGAAALLRRHDPGDGAADAHACGLTLALRPPRLRTFRRASSTSCPSAGSSASGCAPPPGRGTSRRGAARSLPRTDLPDLSTGDSVRHSTLGEGVITRIEPGGVVTVRFAGESSERRLMLEYAPLEKITR